MSHISHWLCCQEQGGEHVSDTAEFIQMTWEKQPKKVGQKQHRYHRHRHYCCFKLVSGIHEI